MKLRRRAVLAKPASFLLLATVGLSCSSGRPPATSQTVSTPPSAVNSTISEEQAWESRTRARVEQLLEESRSLAADGLTFEALARVDEALCEALEPPPRHTISASYLDWAAGLIAEAASLEEDLDLLSAAVQDGELVDLPPIEATSDLELADASAVDSLLPASDFPLELNPTVFRFLEAMTGETEYRNRIEAGMGRAGIYLPMIRAKLLDAGLPQDLAYLPLIESAFSTTAYSRARALGMWQFISGTGRHYGLDVGSLVDERRDPELATDAAVAYLTDLYGEFGDWNLALAAYNSGAGNVRRAIRRSGSRDFWTLQRYLPRETRNYVPAFMASVIVAKQPELYGFTTPIESDWAFDQITVADALDLEFLAGKIDLDLATLRELNPAIRRDLTPAAGRTTIRLPLGYQETAEAILAATPTSEWAPRMMHSVRKGESLYSIAQRYGSSVSAIRQANGIRGNLIHPGQTLVVPRFGDSRPPSTQRIASGGSYLVQRNDTLWDISRSFGTSVDALCAANGLSRGATIRPGQKLTVPGPGSTTACFEVDLEQQHHVQGATGRHPLRHRPAVRGFDLRPAAGQRPHQLPHLPRRRAPDSRLQRPRVARTSHQAWRRGRRRVARSTGYPRTVRAEPPARKLHPRARPPARSPPSPPRRRGRSSRRAARPRACPRPPHRRRTHRPSTRTSSPPPVSRPLRNDQIIMRTRSVHDHPD